MSDEWTVEDLVARNSHELTAHLLLSERRAMREAREQWARERQALLGRIDEAGRIGLRVLTAQAAGRKTVRIYEVVTE